MKANDTALNGSQISLQSGALMGRRRCRLGSLVSQILDKLGARREICFLPFGLSRTRGEGGGGSLLPRRVLLLCGISCGVVVVVVVCGGGVTGGELPPGPVSLCQAD